MQSTRRISTSHIVWTAAFAAIIFLATAYLPRIPIPYTGGYVHIGDAFIYLSACLLPTPLAMAGAAIGAGLADGLTGYAIWMPATIIIKAMMALMFSRHSEKIITFRNGIATVLAGVISIGGYYLYEVLLTASFAAPVVSIFYNLIQVLASALLFILIGIVCDKANLKNRLFK